MKSERCKSGGVDAEAGSESIDSYAGESKEVETVPLLGMGVGDPG